MSTTIARKVVKLLQRSGDSGKSSGGVRLLLSARQREMLDNRWPRANPTKPSQIKWD